MALPTGVQLLGSSIKEGEGQYCLNLLGRFCPSDFAVAANYKI